MNEVNSGSNPDDPPNFASGTLAIQSGAVAERRTHFAVYEDDDGSSPFGPAIVILDF